ncbi:YitT family protein [Facklamia sp. P12945]|uniref:YitT family protein n=1 Tax=unclassified Facklamia TaxID=2622293 RepID=UPI003D173130
MLKRFLSRFLLSKKEILVIALGAFIMAFGLVNIHIPAKITEGGVIGLVLFCYHFFGWEPSKLSFLADITCYLIGLSLLGKDFIRRAIHASFLFAVFYRLCLWMGPVLPSLYDRPLLAAILGGVAIGVGCGLCISQGCAAGGDDALAMVISERAYVSITKAYLLTDGVVLLLSLLYIAPQHLIFSFITTLVSSTIIGQFELHFPSFELPKASSVAKAQ